MTTFRFWAAWNFQARENALDYGRLSVGVGLQAMVNAKISSLRARLRVRLKDPLLTMMTVLLVLMMFVSSPLQAMGFKWFQLLQFLSALGIICGLIVVSGSAVVAVALVAAFAMASVAAIIRVSGPSALDVYLFAISLLIIGISLASVVARATFGHGRVTYHRIIGAVLVYLSIALTFTALYTLIGLLDPAAFSGMSFGDDQALASRVVYFSFVTLTSTGYGDIAPVHPLARSLTSLEAIIGQLYPATLLARLVSLGIKGR